MPQDLGLQGAFGVAGAQQALRQRVLDQLAAEKQKQDLSIQQQDLILRQWQVAGQEADRAGALAERTQAARDTSAAKAAPSLAGANLTGEQFQPFKGTTSEGLFTPQIGLPSRQTQGALPLPGGGPINLGPEAQAMPAPQSLSVPPLITRQAPQRLTGRMIGTGTAEQQKAAGEDAAAAALAADPSTPAAMKLFLRVRSALPKGTNIPADVITGGPIADANYMLAGRPIVGQRTHQGRVLYHGQDVTDQVTPYVAPKDTSGQADTRLDRSYQFNSGQLEAERKPIIDQAERMGRLVTTIDQQSAAADPLIAPELLTAMAGGRGSGLRMNEAEISRMIGGRTKWESIKAAVNKWRLNGDPQAGLSITDEQRGQIRTLMAAMTARLNHKANIVDEAAAGLVDATDVTSHRRIVQHAKQQLNDVTLSAEPAASGGAGMAWLSYQDYVNSRKK